MALDTRLSNVAANAGIDAIAALLNNGYIRIYSGTRPATADTALSGNTLLAEPRFGATAFASAVAGVATANAITDDSTADATGTATFARLLKSDGTTAVEDLEVGTSGANINLNSTAIQINARVSISSMTLTLPKQGA